MRGRILQVGSLCASLSLPIILVISGLLASPVFIKSRLVGLHHLMVSSLTDREGAGFNIFQDLIVSSISNGGNLF